MNEAIWKQYNQKIYVKGALIGNQIKVLSIPEVKAYAKY
jgi:hypothetical protein